MGDPVIKVIIPAFNERNAVGLVIADIPNWVAEVIVINNGSTDDTAAQAQKAGATVINQRQKGYGNACLKGIAYVENHPQGQPDILVFLDADYADHPEQMQAVVAPILSKNVDMVIGSRVLGKREKGAITPQQVFGNWLATRLLQIFYGVTYTDLGPFRAIRFNKLKTLGMVDRNYGWTVEMQLKAAKHKLRFAEVPVDYRKRIGFSKVSGTMKGTIMAGYKIIWTILKHL